MLVKTAKNLIFNCEMKKRIKRLFIVCLTSSSIILAPASQVTALNFTYSQTFDRNEQGQLEIKSNLEINNARNIYILDGINNSVEIFSQVDELKAFQSNFLSTNDKIFSDSENNVYLIDGINNSLIVNPIANNNQGVNGGGNIYYINGFNNYLGEISFSESSGGVIETFNWSKNLVSGQSSQPYWSSEMATEGANNIYGVDGIHNRLQGISFSSNETGNFYVVDGLNNSFNVFNSYQGLNRDGQLNWNKNLVSDGEGNLSWLNEVTSNATKSLFQLDGINQTVQRSLLNQNYDYLYSLDGINNQLQILPPEPSLFSLFNILNQNNDNQWQWFTDEEVPAWDAGNESEFEVEPSLISFFSNFASNNQSISFPENLSLEELETIFGSAFGEENSFNLQFFELLTLLSNNEQLSLTDFLNNDSLSSFNFNDIFITEETQNSPPQTLVSVPEPSFNFGLGFFGLLKLIYLFKKYHEPNQKT